MDVFTQCLQRMQDSCVIKDAEYWDVKLEDGETPVVTECNEKTLCLDTKEGFIIGITIRKGEFNASVIVPKGFNHDELEICGMFDTSTFGFCNTKREYKWCYRYYFYAVLSRPFEMQDLCKDFTIVGPVQVLNDARAFIREMMTKKHTGSIETFHKNLRWMKQRYGVQNADWDVKLEDGDVVVAPNCNSMSIRLCTKDGFMIEIGICPYSSQIMGYIEIPRSLHLFSWLEENAYDKSMIPGIEINLYYKNSNIFQWGYSVRVSDPVRLLGEARNVIRAVMSKETKIIIDKKRQEMDLMREELIMKSCHPKRIATWVEQGFDPFE